MTKGEREESNHDWISLNLNFLVKEKPSPRYEQSPYGVDASLQRFDERETAFSSALFKEKVMHGVPYMTKFKEIAARKIKEKRPGFRQIEYAFKEAAWTSRRLNDGLPLMNWDEEASQLFLEYDKQNKQACRWEGSAFENTNFLKKAITFFGAVAVGVTALKELWVYSYSREGLPIVFSQYDKPMITAEAKIIPSNMNRVIVILVPQNKDLMAFSPSPLADAAVGLGYSRMIEVASKTARFIRNLGYNAIPMGNDTCLSVPLAIDAGLGEMGRHGMLINPRFGSMVRICKVLTDLPLLVDKPIAFGAAEFCQRCTVCAEQCPAKAISFDLETSWEPVCPSSNPGVKKWQVNSWACLKFWAYNGTDCGLCQTVCPFNHQINTENTLTQIGLKYNEPEKWWGNNPS